MKKQIAAAALLALAATAYAGSAKLDGVDQTGDGSATDAYDFGSLSATPEVLFVSVAGEAGASFAEYANFVIDTNSELNAAANTYSLSFFGLNLININNLMVAVWSSTHPDEGGDAGAPIGIFAGDNVTTSLGTLGAGEYHLDITGTLGPTAVGGQYSVALNAVPAIPEPQTYALMLAGLAGVAFMARRRRRLD